MADLADSVARRYAVLRPHLSEFQRRLWLGAEAAELGPGEVATVAEATGSRPTLSVGVARRPRAGQLPARGGPAAPAAAVSGPRPTTRVGRDVRVVDRPGDQGDPSSPLRWTSKSIRSLTGALGKGHRVSDSVTRRLLKERGYSLQANAKTIEGNQRQTVTPSSPTSTTRPRTIWAPGIR